eukprot:COSAG02_NODE_40600_length_403_cov_1.509868_1_plen_26_part_10
MSAHDGDEPRAYIVVFIVAAAAPAEP